MLTKESDAERKDRAWSDESSGRRGVSSEKGAMAGVATELAETGVMDGVAAAAGGGGGSENGPPWYDSTELTTTFTWEHISSGGGNG